MDSAGKVWLFDKGTWSEIDDPGEHNDDDKWDAGSLPPAYARLGFSEPFTLELGTLSQTSNKPFKAWELPTRNRPVPQYLVCIDVGEWGRSLFCKDTPSLLMFMALVAPAFHWDHADRVAAETPIGIKCRQTVVDKSDKARSCRREQDHPGECAYRPSLA